MRLGIVPAADRHHGGVFQYGASVLRALARGPMGAERPTLLGSRGALRDLGSIAPPEWPRLPLYPPLHPARWADRLRELGGEGLVGRARQWWPGRASTGDGTDGGAADAGRWYRRNDLGFLFWTVPHPLAFRCGLPFAMSVHDLQHRLNPRFPEVSAGGEYERRELILERAARAATVLVADSEIGREDILAAYGELIEPERVKVLPYVAPPNITPRDPERQIADCRARWPLPARYFFYPAHFWPHKNHAAVVRALSILAGRGRDVAVVFCGSREGRVRRDTFLGVQELSARLGVGGRVTALDYVPDAMLGGLYLEAVGLVMPTYFGPTNLPVLEAWTLGCPVVTSDIRGVREQAGDAALLVDPDSPESLAEAMDRLWIDAGLRERLAAAGRRRLALWTEADFAAALAEILDEARALAAGVPQP